MQGAAVTMDFMQVLGMQPLIGRMFTQEEDSPNGPLVTLIGEAVWHERFSGRADVLGKELKLNSRTLHDHRRAAEGGGISRRRCACGCRCRAIPTSTRKATASTASRG